MLVAASAVTVSAQGTLGQAPSVPLRSAPYGATYAGQVSAAATMDRGNTQTAASTAMRPVRRESIGKVAPPSPPSPHQPKREGWNLKWRRSSSVSKAQPSPTLDAAKSTESGAAAVQQTSGVASRSGPGAVTQAAWLTQPPSPGGQGLSLPADTLAPPAGDAETNFFADPFGDDPVAAAARAKQSETAMPVPEPIADPVRPTAPVIENQLRLDNPAPSRSLEAPRLRQDAPAAPVKQRAATGGDEPSLAEMMREHTLAQQEQPLQSEQVPPPTPRTRPLEDTIEDPFFSPFDSVRDRDADERDRDQLNQRALQDGDMGTFSREPRPAGTKGFAISCDEFRRRIERERIVDVSLDISPPFRPDVIDEEEYQSLKGKFDDAQEVRVWRNIQGRELASGRLRDLAYEKAVIETEYGSMETLAMNQLSEADLAYISDNWGLPKQCLLEQVAYVPRAWTPMTMTWRASNLCHKPLYFEEVNLERYGHTAGPVLQPAVSSAHFFLNIAVLPYKMGVHTPGECQYALGYYRPGNCAPWIVPPVPISLRGGLSQAAVMTGLFWLVP